MSNDTIAAAWLDHLKRDRGLSDNTITTYQRTLRTITFDLLNATYNDVAPKTITFYGQRYRTTSLRAEVESIARDWGFSPDELVEWALLNLAARREFGRGAWVRNTRANLRTVDGSRREIEVTVGLGARNRDGSQDVDRMFVAVERDEIDAARAALAATEA